MVAFRPLCVASVFPTTIQHALYWISKEYTSLFVLCQMVILQNSLLQFSRLFLLKTCYCCLEEIHLYEKQIDSRQESVWCIDKLSNNSYLLVISYKTLLLMQIIWMEAHFSNDNFSLYFHCTILGWINFVGLPSARGVNCCFLIYLSRKIKMDYRKSW